MIGGQKLPVFTVELDGREHIDNEVGCRRDVRKSNICRRHGFEIIRIENSYARRYGDMKSILIG